MSAAPHPEHGLEELCPAGTALYELALREGRISGAEAAAAPCLLRFGLLQPTVTDMDVLKPVAAAVARERLLVFDRAVAFIPANKERTPALEIRHPAMVDYLVTVFDRLRHLATPMYPEIARPPAPGGITPRRRAIAALLVEGHTGTAIADRLGMNVRTARLHIAELAAALGSESRAQLGYLIGESGILKQEEISE